MGAIISQQQNLQEGDDDMFSADLSSEERHFRLGHMASVPTAAFLSGADQFVPPLPPVPEGGGGGGGGRSPVEALAATFRAAMIGSSSSAAFSTASRTPDDAASPAASCAAAIGSSSDSCARSGQRITVFIYSLHDLFFVVCVFVCVTSGGNTCL